MYASCEAEQTITPIFSGIQLCDPGPPSIRRYQAEQASCSSLVHGRYPHTSSSVKLETGRGEGQEGDYEGYEYDLSGDETYAFGTDNKPSSSSLAAAAANRRCHDDKVCSVCGDKALGYNFDAISCESCKAFFRRNAPRGLERFKCPYEERCRVDVNNRRFCKHCRLKQCFAAGMKKEYIMSEDEKTKKKVKIDENRMLRELERSGLLRDPEMASQTKPLSDTDSDVISELVAAYDESLRITVDETVSRETAHTVIDLANIAEISVRRVIDMAKKVKSFKSLTQADQISLLKGGSIELLIIRAVLTYDKDKGHFLDPADQEETSAMSMQQLARCETGTGLFDDYMKFVRSLAVELRANKTALILLLMIALFSPDRLQLEQKETVAEEQERYSVLLQRYLESQHPVAIAHMIYPKMLLKLTDIRELSEKHSHVLLKANPEGIVPLMREVLDILP